MNRPLDRRCLMKTAGVMALATAAGTLRGAPAFAQQVPWSSGTEAPKLKAPANACDCHMHIYDAKYPVAANATLKPADALVTDYKLLQKRIGGLERGNSLRFFIWRPVLYLHCDSRRHWPAP